MKRHGDSRATGAQETLYHVSPGAVTNERRFILITYHFPPDRLVGGLRWQEMSRHFAERGWGLDVVTRDFTDLPDLDFTRLDQLPSGLRVFSVPDRDPLVGRLHSSAMRLLRRLRHRRSSEQATRAAGDAAPPAPSLPAIVKAYLALLSVQRAGEWARAASRVASELAQTNQYAAVISSGPPHMAHEAARVVAQKMSLPLTIDMRDPWSLVERVPDELDSPLWFFMARRTERSVIRSAALITMNTEGACEAMRTAYPQFAGSIHVVRNGADGDSLPTLRRDGVFRIRFAGSVYLDRDPRLLFRAASRVITELTLTPDRFIIEFAGDPDPRLMHAIAAEEGVAQFLRMKGVLPRKLALEFLAGATMLLNLAQDSTFAIPAKIYEYVRMNAWMLVLARRDSATARLLVGSEAIVIDPSDVDAIASAIHRCVKLFENGIDPIAAGHDGRFDRRLQSAKLIDLIERLVIRSA